MVLTKPNQSFAPQWAPIVVNSSLKPHTNTNYDVWSKGKW